MLEKLTATIAGDSDATVTGQIKTLKSDLRDDFKTLTKTLNANNENIIRELNNFGKTLAESNTKAFIEALNDTMKDFNQKLTEQFGENFKQLNVAVGRLLEWQENYKIVIEKVTQNLQTSVEGINAVKISVAQIEKSAAAMTESSEQIKNLIVTANFYEQKLEEVLKEVQTLGEISKSAVPNVINFLKISCDEIQSYTEQATQDLNSHVNVVIDNLSEKMLETIHNTGEMAKKLNNVGNIAIQKLDSAAYETIDALKQVAKNIEKTSIQQREIMDAEVTATKEAVRKAAAELNNSTFKITRDISDSLHKMMMTNNQNLQTSSENLRKDLDKKITDSLNSLGNAMFEISNKFAVNYSILAEKVRKMLEEGNKV